jgi:CubicO group peptidase (beta-lactamase class C family)
LLYYSNARDFAQFGKLYKQYGKWNGKQILDSTFVATSITPRFTIHHYGYGWWVCLLAKHEGKQVLYARDHLGQYTIVIPKTVSYRAPQSFNNAQQTVNQKMMIFMVWVAETYKMLALRK